jgi:ankyrin repeat protein
LITEGNSSIFSQDEQGYHPFSWACQYGRTDIAIFLLQHADPKERQKMLTLQDKFGWTPIHKAAEANSAAIVKLLVESYNVDPVKSISEGDHRTPLDLANSTEAKKVIEYLTGVSQGLIG